ncbi:MAG: hypothetical protein JWQ22_2331 [Devosia sp.]|nr:hypothetical protein [Devosia sp.]
MTRCGSLQFIFDWGLIGARRTAQCRRKGPRGRHGPGGRRFIEFTSRDNDPQIHSHAYVDPLDIEVGVALRAGGRNKRKKTGSLKVSVGDRIVFGETVLLPERIIRNADVARVLDIQAGPPPRLTLEFEADGSCITRDMADLLGFRDQHEVKLPLVRHAYAATMHFAQGRTVDRAYIASTRAMSREAIYVAMTRHRHVAQLFVDTTRFKPISVTSLPNALLSLLGKRDRNAEMGWGADSRLSGVSLPKRTDTVSSRIASKCHGVGSLGRGALTRSGKIPCQPVVRGRCCWLKRVGIEVCSGRTYLSRYLVDHGR